jgi:hypothetical protein
MHLPLFKMPDAPLEDIPSHGVANPVPMPLSHNRFRTLAIIGIGVCVVVGGVWWYVHGEPYISVKKLSQTPTSTITQSRNDSTVVSVAQIEREKEEILRRATIVFPSIISTASQPGVPPDDLYPLVEHESNVSISEVSYVDGSNGHIIEFVYLGTTADAPKRFGYQLNGLGWSLLSGGRNDNFGFMDVEHGTSRTRINYTRIDATTTHILIQTIEPVLP